MSVQKFNCQKFHPNQKCEPHGGTKKKRQGITKVIQKSVKLLLRCFILDQKQHILEYGLKK